MYDEFLPISKQDMLDRGWYYYDFLLVTGDAYVDHPSFGVAIISRILESKGFRVAILAQPNYKNADDFRAMGRPRYAALITAGNIDSMVAHYTAAKKKRSEDTYSPGGVAGKRPDRACIVYTSKVKEAFPGLPVCLGGLEASLRRFSHYDYWDDKVRRPIIFDSKADIVMFGMGENEIIELSAAFKKGKKVNEIRNIRGTCYVADSPDACEYPYVYVPSHEEQISDKRKYAEAAMSELREFDHIRGKAIIEKCGDKFLIQNPPPIPIDTQQFDKTYELPYTRKYHPSYEPLGGVPALKEVEFSVIHNRGCFGGCNFCALAFHQGRFVSVRSHDSVINEVKMLTKNPNFKGYIHDIGGPTANFSRPACDKQKKFGLCADKRCLFPQPCKNLVSSHAEYLKLLTDASKVEGVKKVFVRSGLRYDFMMSSENGSNKEFFAALVKNHISGQLKVAPEHISDNVLYYMGKPSFAVYKKFTEEFKRLNQKYNKKQFLVPYLMSSHPGSTLDDAIKLAQYLDSIGHMPEQVQDFYPTPGTLSTAMYYTEIDPRTGKSVYVPKTAEEKAMQRALLQWRKPQNHRIIMKALKLAGREDLIGYKKGCLIPPFVRKK